MIKKVHVAKTWGASNILGFIYLFIAQFGISIIKASVMHIDVLYSHSFV